MPFFKRAAGSSPFKSKKKSKREVGLPPSTAIKVKRLLRNVEEKSIGLTSATSDTNDFSQSGSVTLINGCTQGISGSNRVGRLTHMTHLEMRILVSSNDDGAPPVSLGMWNGCIRVMIVYDTQSNGAAPAAGDILAAAVAVGCKNMNNRKRFKIIYDQTRPLNDINGGSGPASQVFVINKKLNLPVDYGLGTTSAITSITKGGLFLVTFSEVNGTEASVPASLWSSNVLYTDD